MDSLPATPLPATLRGLCSLLTSGSTPWHYPLVCLQTLQCLLLPVCLGPRRWRGAQEDLVYQVLFVLAPTQGLVRLSDPPCSKHGDTRLDPGLRGLRQVSYTVWPYLKNNLKSASGRGGRIAGNSVPAWSTKQVQDGQGYQRNPVLENKNKNKTVITTF